MVLLSHDADEIRKEYQGFVEAKLGNEWEHMRDWGGKLVGAMVRIAALLHLSSFPATEPISAETMAGATSIAEFLGAHAMAAYQMMGGDEAQENAKYILKRVASEGKKKLTRSELTRLCRGKFQKADDMAPAINELSDRGYIRRLEDDVGYNNRKQVVYEINPLTWGK